MARRFGTVLLALVVGVLAWSGTALAGERPGSERSGDRHALCERLESKATALRAEIGRIEAIQERIQAKLASGELNRRQEARAKHALRLLEARQDALVAQLERVLEAYEEKCTR